MREEDFWASTYRAIYNRMEGFAELEQDRQNEAWRRARMLAFYFVQPYSKSIKRPQQLFELPGDDTEEITEADKEAMKELFAAWDQKMKNGIK